MVLTLLIDNGLSIAILPERLDGTNSSQAEGEISAVFDAELPVIFDATRCIYISSAGLRLLLATAKRMMPLDLPVVITGMGENLIDIMRMTGFDHIFVFTPDMNQAIDKAKTKG